MDKSSTKIVKAPPTARSSVEGRIRERRRELRLSQPAVTARLAERGVSLGQNGISRVENGAASIKAEHLSAWAYALETSVSWLAQGEREDAAPVAATPEPSPAAVPTADEAPAIDDYPLPSIEQQRAALDVMDASPMVRKCWTIHVKDGFGAHQRITNAYMRRFVWAAEAQLANDPTDCETIATLAGEAAFNAAVEAHAKAIGAKRKP